MGGCFSKQEIFSGVSSENEDGKNKTSYQGDREKAKREEDETNTGTNNGMPRVMLRGSCRYASMFTQQGRKGVNQDTMTIWEVRCMDTHFPIS